MSHLPNAWRNSPSPATVREMSTLNWGILGCARVTRQVMGPGIRQSKNGRILAVASRDVERARQLADALRVERVHGSYEELLDDPDVQAVYIPLPNSLHREWTIKAAASGKHVLCEKPLASNAQEAADMVKACEENGVLLMESFASRFHPQNLGIRSLLDEGRLGEPLRMTAVHSSDRPQDPTDIRLNRELSGGVLMDKGCYCVNMARFMFGAEPNSVFARVEFGQDSAVDERVIVTLCFPAGGVAQFDSGFHLSPGRYRQSYQLYCQSGHIHVPSGFSQVETYRHGTIRGTSYYVADDDAVDPGVQRIDCDGVHIWQLAAEFFADCVLNGRQLRWPAENGLANMRVIDAIYESARQDRPISRC